MDQLPDTLRTEFAGVAFRSPVGVAPHAPYAPNVSTEQVADKLIEFAEAGAGYVYTHWISNDPPSGRIPVGYFMRVETKGFGKEGLFAISDPRSTICDRDNGLRLIGDLRQRLPVDVPVIANIAGPGANLSGWVDLAKAVEGAGANLVELNVGCPYCTAEKESVSGYLEGEVPNIAGAVLGDIFESTGDLVRKVRQSVSIPVGIKKSPEIGYPRLVELCNHLMDADVDFVSSINSPVSVAPPDIFNGGKSPWPFFSDNPIGCALGPWDRYQCYRDVATLNLHLKNGVDVAAIGGIVDPIHAIEMLMLGAKIIELSSGIFWKGSKLITRCNEFLTEYLERNSISSVSRIVGLGLQYLRPIEDVDWQENRLVARVDSTKCTGCGICATNHCYASFVREGKSWIEEKYCGGCGLCVAVCPSNAREVILG
jgi:dihydropyrimidine dehydrogenase (NAD+) subunit PreA